MVPIALAALSGGLLVSALGWASGCSASDPAASLPPSTDGGAGGYGGDGGSPAFGGMGGEVSVGVGGACGPSCSSNLKNVLDCEGNVVSTCPDDQACLDGGCMDDPCAAADAAKSSYGCDYWALKVDMLTEGRFACFAAFVANTWSVPVHLNVEYQGTPLPIETFARIPKGQGASLVYDAYDEVAGLPPGEVAVLFLAREAPSGFYLMPDCPVPAALDVEVGTLGTGIGNAFHISADRPVVAYQMLPFGGGSAAATSATLLLPTSAWDESYLAINAYAKNQVGSAAGAPSLDILAHEDDTTVTLLPNVSIVGGVGVPASPANQPVSVTLDRGQYLQITQPQELTGSPIQADKPVAVFGASTSLNVPVFEQAADSAQQQLPPLNALGHEYVAVRYRARAPNEAPPWRLVGAVDGTVLSWEPAPPAGAPTSIELGQVAEFNATGPFVVRSQDADHAFYLAAYMTGGQAYNGEGDPEWVNVIPSAQYLDSYVFFTDPTYSETSLVLVRSAKGGTFADVTLDCAGVVDGWQAVGDYEYARVDLVTGNFDDVGSCSNGRHQIDSSQPFGVTVWGWGKLPFSSPTVPWTTYVSYAYPGGAGFQSINQAVLPPLR